MNQMYLALVVLFCLATLLTIGLRGLQSLVEAPDYTVIDD